ncbi:MAG: hypothetical protein GY765_29250 [bacterium]|nr:hypothetical protein [bacterium]
MVYIVLTIIGLLAAVLLKETWEKNKQLMFMLAAVLLGTAGYIAFDIIASDNGGVISKGTEDIWAQIPWKDIGMYFCMAAGMISKYLFDSIGDRKRGRIKLYKWQLIKPLLVSPIVFVGVYSQLPVNTGTFILLLFSYQNGFFWQTLLYKAYPGKDTK